MAAHVVFENVAEDAGVAGQLFAGLKFWVAQRVPHRSHLLQDIRNNGGVVTLLEKQADYKIADPFRKDCPPGTISYKFIDESVKHGVLKDPTSYVIGQRVEESREVGSLTKSAKSGRTKYTAEEDKILYKWVRDHEGRGDLAGGNKMYKELEQKYPQHPWQSWRDRYLKQLQHRTPSAFNIPDNAPPSPPSDAPSEPAKAPAQTEHSQKKPSPASKLKVESSVVEELQTIGKHFDKADFQGIYAFVDTIKNIKGEDYTKAWNAYAENTLRTAEQWRQFYEKIVKPKWDSDPPEKRAETKQREEARLKGIEDIINTTSNQSDTDEEGSEDKIPVQSCEESTRPTTKGTKRKRSRSEDDRFDEYLKTRHKGKSSSAYVLFARGNKYEVWDDHPDLDYTELHIMLLEKWSELSADEKAPYYEQLETANSRNEEEMNETAVNVTPKYVAKADNKALKPIRNAVGIPNPSDDETEVARPAKRQKSESPLFEPEDDFTGVTLVAQQQAFELSSAMNSLSQDSVIGLASPAAPTKHPALQTADADDSDMEGLEPIAPPRVQLDPLNSDKYRLDTSTPRAPRHASRAFETQAIISSPMEDAPLSALPLPDHFTQLDSLDILPGDDRILYSSPGGEMQSNASTTQSLQEFRRSLDEAPLSSPPDDTEDPDPPLEASEVDVFFEEQCADGFNNQFIASALKHTRWRPWLAIEVLEAWRAQKPLPNRRGIWSREDDEDLENGTAPTLARLVRKHTLDGWGGVTERQKFLAAVQRL